MALGINKFERSEGKRILKAGRKLKEGRRVKKKLRGLLKIDRKRERERERESGR